MPRSNTNEPPPRMTWGKAAPALIVSALFDVLRYTFLAFWFFGPALAAAYCAIIGGEWVQSVTRGLLGTGTAALVCTIAGGTVGYFGAPVFIAFGTVMAIVTAFAGFLTVFILLAMFNTRIFKEPTVFLWALVGLGISITATTWKLFYSQIKREKAAYKKWEEETAAMRKRAQQQKLEQVRMLQMEQAQYAQKNEIY